MDLSDNGSVCEEEMNCRGRTPDRIPSSGSSIKTCVDCGTSKTPLWRGGPAGPKSLCNACGIRSRKKRRGLSGLAKEDKKCKKSSHWSPRAGHHSSSSSQSSTSSSAESSLRNNRGDELKSGGGSWGFGGDVALQRPRSNITRRRKLGEEEQAAFLLLALSCGSVYA